MLAKSVGVLAAGVAGWAAGKWIGGKLSESVGNKSTEEGDTSSMWGAGLGAALALGIGAALAIPTGGLSLLGAAGLGFGGALAGGAIGKVGGDAMNQPVNDGKFSGYDNKIGSDFNKGRGILQGGKITPINNKDDILAMKPGGPVDNMMSKNTGVNNIKHEFGELTINGKIEVTSPGNSSTAVDLMRNPQFIRELQMKISQDLIMKENQMLKRG